MGNSYEEKLKKLPGSDQDPFKVPVGPTPECLSSYALVDFMNQGEKDADVILHVEDCEPCRKRIAWFKSSNRIFLISPVRSVMDGKSPILAKNSDSMSPPWKNRATQFTGH